MKNNENNELMTDKDFDLNVYLSKNISCETWEEIEKRKPKKLQLTHGYNAPIAHGYIEYIEISQIEFSEHRFNLDGLYCLAYSKGWTSNQYDEAHLRLIQYFDSKNIDECVFVELNEYHKKMDARNLLANEARIVGVITTITNHYHI